MTSHKISEYVAAIDIGTTKIVAMIGQMLPTGKIDIIAISKTESHGVRRGMVFNIEETATDVEKVFKEVQKQSGLSFNEVYVGIAAQHIRCIKQRHYFNRDNVDDLITQSDLDRLKSEVSKTAIDPTEQIIEIIPQHYIVDNEGEIKNPIGMRGKRIECNFNIIVSQTVSIENIKRCLEMKGLKVKGLMLEPLASSAAVITEDEKEMGIALIDIGGGTTDIAVFHDNELKHTAVVPFGGFSITKDIKEGCGILQKQAEELKLKYGSAFGNLADPNKVVVLTVGPAKDQREISCQTLAGIIQARMTEIISMAMYEVENSEYLDKLHGGIVITGGGALLTHLPQLFNFETGLYTRIGYPGRLFSDDVAKHYNSPIYATGLGLILEGFEREKQGDSTISFELIKNEETNTMTKDTTSQDSDIQQEIPIAQEQAQVKKGKFFKNIKNTFDEFFGSGGVFSGDNDKDDDFFR